MVSVRHEATDETARRLQGVLGLAEPVALPGAWSLVQSPRDRPPVPAEHRLAV